MCSEQNNQLHRLMAEWFSAPTRIQVLVISTSMPTPEELAPQHLQWSQPEAVRHGREARTASTLQREEELTKRDKLNLDIFWPKDESLEDSANLPDPDVIAAEIVEDLEAALQQFAAIADDLRGAPALDSPRG